MTVKHLKIKKEETLLVLSEKEKILNFLNSALTATGQKEFYNTKEEQRLAILETHMPLLKKYRKFYALLLLSGINDLNKQIIIYNLLNSGSKQNKNQKEIELELIFQSLTDMRTPRAYKTFRLLRTSGVNNSRTRRLATKFLQSRKNIAFEAVKYRKVMKELAIHNHVHIDSEVFDFLFSSQKELEKITFSTDIFSTYVAARKDPEKLYELPYTVAQGFASYHKIPRDKFLERIKGEMTEHEKLASQQTAKKEGVQLKVNLSKFNLVKLFKYLRTVDKITDEHRAALQTIAQREADNLFIPFSKIRVVIDNSGSAYGSAEKKFHPISVSQAISEVLRQKATDFKEYYTNKGKQDILAPVSGSTHLATAVVAALKDKPEVVVIISDGYENRPAGLTSQIVDAYKEKIDTENETKIFHINPVFAAEVKTTRSLGDNIPSIGLRSSTQLGTGYFLLAARENLNQALSEFEQHLLEKKKSISLKNIKVYLLPRP